MAFRRILKYPSSDLLKRSEVVSEITEGIVSLVADLRDTLNVAGGAGLSAPQIGFHHRVIYISCPEFTGEMINPVIKSFDDIQGMIEGCLSFPGVVETISRYSRLTVEYQALDGSIHTKDLEGLPAQVVQHEIEHLDGKLMVDKLSRLKRGRAIKRVKKVRREVDTMLYDDNEKKISRTKKDSHLSLKEIKNRRKRRKQNR
jgi:peptide deformylase